LGTTEGRKGDTDPESAGLLKTENRSEVPLQNPEKTPAQRKEQKTARG